MEKKGQLLAEDISINIGLVSLRALKGAAFPMALPHAAIPVEIFSQNLSPLEAVTSFLKNNYKLRFCHIAKVLNRDIRTIWITYLNSQKKQKVLVLPDTSQLTIPLEILSNRRFSITEIIVLYLIDMRGLTLTQAASLLNKSTSTVWTSHQRARKKLGVGR